MSPVRFSIWCLLLFSCAAARAGEIDSLLRVLDHTIQSRATFQQDKEQRIDSINAVLRKSPNPEARYRVHGQLIDEYQSFQCDSALMYIDRNIAIAETEGRTEWLYESRLRQAFVLSLSGIFSEALTVLQALPYDQLPKHLKVLYCWTYIRYCENLIQYTENPRYNQEYAARITDFRERLMGLLNPASDMFLKEKAFSLQAEGRYPESADIQEQLFRKVPPYTHDYAMSAMGLALIHRALGNRDSADRYLIEAAITDVRLAVKENESLLTLAVQLHERGDVNRAYSCIQAALDDANFYNSRFRNAVIARSQPIIEATYLAKISEQRRNLRLYAFVISAFAVILLVTLYMLYRQIRSVSNARKHLKAINDQLILVNQKLDEANLIRERYIGYYLNQCAVYLDKLDDFRKLVGRKIKAGQLDDLKQLVASPGSLQNEARALYTHFDQTFLEVYPAFVDDFNRLLREDERYQLKPRQLNTELRIFALIRLGITDVTQIAVFLRYSVQTIYNYKSKVKGKALSDPDQFEEKVRKLGSFSPERLNPVYQTD